MYIMARISTIYGNQIVTEYLVFIVFIIDYKSGIIDRKLRIITCIYRTEFFFSGSMKYGEQLYIEI